MNSARPSRKWRYSFSTGSLTLTTSIGEPPDIVRGADDLGPRCLVFVVGQGGELPGIVLHQHGMAGCDQRVNSGRGNADPAFVVLNFLWERQ